LTKVYLSNNISDSTKIDVQVDYDEFDPNVENWQFYYNDNPFDKDIIGTLDLIKVSIQNDVNREREKIKEQRRWELFD